MYSTIDFDYYYRKHPFKLKGGLWFFSESKYFFSLRSDNIFFSKKIFFKPQSANRIFFLPINYISNMFTSNLRYNKYIIINFFKMFMVLLISNCRMVISLHVLIYRGINGNYAFCRVIAEMCSLKSCLFDNVI